MLATESCIWLLLRKAIGDVLCCLVTMSFPVPPNRGPSFRELMEDNRLTREENCDLIAQNDCLTAEIQQLRRDKAAQNVLISVLKKRIRMLSSQEPSSSASRSSHPSPVVKRPRPPGLIHEEQTKKLASEPPRPSCAAKPTQRVTSASRST